MAKEQKNVLPIPPELRRWTMVLKSGHAFDGEITAVYDNASVMKTEKYGTVIIMTSEVEVCIENNGQPGKEVVKE